MTLSGCTNTPDKTINRLVEQLNSQEFKQKEMLTGLFTDTRAEATDSALVMTFTLAPQLSLARVNENQTPMLHESAVTEFRAQLADPTVSAGLKALADKHMIIRMVWIDSSGRKVDVEVDPAAISEYEPQTPAGRCLSSSDRAAALPDQF